MKYVSIILDLTIEENNVTLINIYGPNVDSPLFYEIVRDAFLEFDNEYYILCGDLNLALNPNIDTYNYLHVNNPNARDKIFEIMEDLQLVDYYRILHPEKRVYTWRKKTPLKQGRLDYILISQGLSNIVENFSIKPGYRSDHSAVVMELKFNPFIRVHGLWKFNNSLLYDDVYVAKVKQTIQEVKKQYKKHSTKNADDPNYIEIVDDSILLEVLLMEIRGITISYSSYKKKEKDKLEKVLLNEINHLESDVNIDVDLVEEKRSALESIRKEKMQGHIVRSRARWVEEGEKPTKYFCNLESRNFINKTIKRVDDGHTTFHEQFEILNQVKSFYEALYLDKDAELTAVDLDNIIDSSNIKKLDEHISHLLDKNIVESEILEVLKNMKNNKSPGSDGYTTEFFKFFWSDLKHFILEAINCIFTKKELPITQRLGIISCLPKGDKPRQILKKIGVQ